MILTFKNRLYIGFTLAVLLCVISGLTSYFILQRQQTQRISLRIVRRVLDSTTHIQGYIIDMETGRRGFRATNEKRFLEPYYNGINHITAAKKALDSLSFDDTTKMKSRLLEDHINTLMSFWQNKGEDASTYTRSDITRITDSEKAQMDEIRKNISSLQGYEAKLMARDREEYDHLIHYGTISSIIDSAVSLTIIIILIVIVIREFSTRRRTEEQLHHTVNLLETQAEVLKKSEAQLTTTLSDLGHTNKQLEKFVYTVAHDIKSPLSGIIGALTVISDDEDVVKNIELSEFADLSMNAALRLSDMVNALLEYSRLSIKEKTLEQVDTKALLEETAVLLFPPKNIIISIAGDMPVIKTKKLLIQQVFQNLLSNAIKYNGKEKGLIEVGYKDMDDRYQFYVRDNGQGIPGDDKERVFALLATASNRSASDSSTGFGLNIVKLIVEEQRGRIWYDSVMGKGTTFYFEWIK